MLDGITPVIVSTFALKLANTDTLLIGVLLTGDLIGVTYLLKQGLAMKLLAPLPLLGVIVMDGFEIFVAFIQAFIFALLTALYLGEAMEESH